MTPNSVVRPPILNAHPLSVARPVRNQMSHHPRPLRDRLYNFLR